MKVFPMLCVLLVVMAMPGLHASQRCRSCRARFCKYRHYCTMKATPPADCDSLLRELRENLCVEDWYDVECSVDKPCKIHTARCFEGQCKCPVDQAYLNVSKSCTTEWKGVPCATSDDCPVENSNCTAANLCDCAEDHHYKEQWKSCSKRSDDNIVVISAARILMYPGSTELATTRRICFDYDPASGLVYSIPKNGQVTTDDLDGTLNTLVNLTLDHVNCFNSLNCRVDPLNRMLFFTDNQRGNVQAIDLRNPTSTPSIILGRPAYYLQWISGLAVDPKNKWVYISTTGKFAGIMRVGYDGKGFKDLVKSPLYTPGDLTLDYTNNVLYFTDKSLDVIEALNLTSMTRSDVYSLPCRWFEAMTYVKSKLYFFAATKNKCRPTSTSCDQYKVNTVDVHGANLTEESDYGDNKRIYEIVHGLYWEDFQVEE